MTKSNLLVVGPSGSDATFIRFVAQPRSITPSRRTLSHGVEACPHARKVLFRALLTQLHPGRSGAAMRLPRTGEGTGVPWRLIQRERG